MVEAWAERERLRGRLSRQHVEEMIRAHEEL